MTAPRSASIAAGLLIVGLVAGFDPGGWYPFGPVKWAIATTIGCGLLAVLLWHDSLQVHRRAAWVWAGFLIWGAAASLGALDPVYTWLGTPDRRLGLAAWILFGMLFIAGHRLRIRPLARAAAVALGLAGIYVVLELVGWAPVALAAGTRPGGPFGSAAYVGAATVLLVPAAVALAAAGISVPVRVAAGTATVLGLAAALAGQARGAWMGLLAAAVVAFPAWREPARRHLGTVIPVALALVAAFVLSPLGSRAAAIWDFDDGPVARRFDEWQVATAVVLAHPVTGTGFEGYRIAFPSHVDEAYERRYGRSAIPDRAHNGALDVAATAGLPALTLYLTGAVWLVVRARRAARSGDVLLAGIGAGVAGYLVQQQVLFPIAEVEPVFWIMAGALVAATSAPSELATFPRSRTAAAALLVLAAAAFVAGGLDVSADRVTRSALVASGEGRHSDALAGADRAVGLRPDSIRYRVAAATVARRRATPDGLSRALDRVDGALVWSPADPVARSLRAGILLDRARLTGFPDAVDAAAAVWTELVAADPHNASHRVQHGVALFLAGDAAGAEATWRRAADLAPASPVPTANLAVLYLDRGRWLDARAAVERVRAIDPAYPALTELERRLDRGE